jgi:hypothetical protein
MHANFKLLHTTFNCWSLDASFGVEVNLPTHDVIFTTVNKLFPIIIDGPIIVIWNIFVVSVLTCLWLINVSMWDKVSLLQDKKSLQVALDSLHNFNFWQCSLGKTSPYVYWISSFDNIADVDISFTLRLLFPWRSKNIFFSFKDMLLTCHIPSCIWMEKNTCCNCVNNFLFFCVAIDFSRNCLKIMDEL